MATIKDVIDSFDTAVDSSSYFQQFVADDLDTINEDNKNTYPYLMLVPVSEVDNNPRRESSYSTFTIELYANDLQYQGAGDERPTRHSKWDDLKSNLKTLFTLLPNTTVLADSPITYTYGYAQHNDDVVVVKADLSVIIFDC